MAIKSIDVPASPKLRSSDGEAGIPPKPATDRQAGEGGPLSAASETSPRIGLVTGAKVPYSATNEAGTLVYRVTG